jgi:hypothetical protein
LVREEREEREEKGGKGRKGRKREERRLKKLARLVPAFDEEVHGQTHPHTRSKHALRSRRSAREKQVFQRIWSMGGLVTLSPGALVEGVTSV